MEDNPRTSHDSISLIIIYSNNIVMLSDSILTSVQFSLLRVKSTVPNYPRKYCRATQDHECHTLPCCELPFCRWDQLSFIVIFSFHWRIGRHCIMISSRLINGSSGEVIIEHLSDVCEVSLWSILHSISNDTNLFICFYLSLLLGIFPFVMRLQVTSYQYVVDILWWSKSDIESLI